MAVLTATRLEPQAPTWGDAVDALRAALGAPGNPRLLPPHFLKSTFPKIGGHVVRFDLDGRLAAVGFLCPRGERAGHDVFTLRCHRLPGVDFDLAAAVAALQSQLAGAEFVPYVVPDQLPPCHRTGDAMGGVEVGRPDAAEAEGIRAMQQAIWDTDPDFLYPADLHSAAFPLGTSLVARVDGALAGFLFGFYTFDGEPVPAAWQARLRTHFRLESQLMGVLPAFRGRSLSFWLKRAQAQGALAEGIDLVNWTVDPLQWTNAVLNFGALKALAFDFHGDYYAFRNSLNRVSASRLGLTWLVASGRVRTALAGSSRAQVADLDAEPATPRLDHPARLDPATATADRLAIEVPADWTVLQRDDVGAAAAWRQHTDAVFRALIGHEPGRHALTGVGTAGGKRYLVAERITDASLARWGP